MQEDSIASSVDKAKGAPPTDEWYQEVAKTNPPKDKPWYHILVNDEDYTTYVAERNMLIQGAPEPIKHPLLKILFDNFDGDSYKLKIDAN